MGDAVSAMDTDERATLTNMAAEIGGFTGLVAPDAETVRFVKERRGEHGTVLRLARGYAEQGHRRAADHDRIEPHALRSEEPVELPDRLRWFHGYHLN
jgi:3-isopropylmalate/(R)-2-methylmalate dehydratase large subunit